MTVTLTGPAGCSRRRESFPSCLCCLPLHLFCPPPLPAAPLGCHELARRSHARHQGQGGPLRLASSAALARPSSAGLRRQSSNYMASGRSFLGPLRLRACTCLPAHMLTSAQSIPISVTLIKAAAHPRGAGGPREGHREPRGAGADPGHVPLARLQGQSTRCLADSTTT
jgi:hypothetical protein